MQRLCFIATVAIIALNAGVALAQNAPAAGTAPAAAAAGSAAAPAATTTTPSADKPAATTTTEKPAAATTDKPESKKEAAEPKKKKTEGRKMTRQQEIDKSIDSGTVPSRYRSQVPKQYHHLIPFDKQ
jgi:Rieske Fe-S protein